MVNKKAWILIIFSLTGMLILSSRDAMSQKACNPVNNGVSTEVQLLISDYGNFTLAKDQNQIDSQNNLSTISFKYNGNSGAEELTEVYLLSFAEFGNATNFSLELFMNCSYEFLEDVASSLLTIGSFYDNDLQWVGFPNEAISPVCIIGCQDLWKNSTGRFVNMGYPFDHEEVNATAMNTLGLFNDLQINVQRNATGLFTSIRHAQNQSIILQKDWRHGIWKPVNYLMLSFSTIENSSTNDQAIWRSISGSFDFDYFAPIIPPNSSLPNFTLPTFTFPGFTISLTITTTLLITMATLLQRPKKKKSKQ